MRKTLLFALALVARIAAPLMAAPLMDGQTTIFNCSSFAASGACSVVGAASESGITGNFVSRNGGGLSGSVINFIPANSGHNGYGLTYITPQNIEAFSTTFSFIPNGQNLAFVIQNTNNTPGYQGANFSSGAGCEGGFYQSFSGNKFPNNLFALEFDSDSFLDVSDTSFTHSSVQIYMSGQSPCLPNDSGPSYWPVRKFSTSPVTLNWPLHTKGTTTGDTYSATVTYDGSNLVVSLFDVTLGHSCPGTNCFTHTWSNVRLPSLVGANTAYLGFTGGINLENLPQETIRQWSYTVKTPTAKPTSAPPVAGGTPAKNPIFTPSAGSYSKAQSVSLSSPTAGSYFCYTLAPTCSGIAPLPDNFGGCAVGTKYTGAVSVPSSESMCAITGTNTIGLPSGVEQAAYTIIGTAGPAGITPTAVPAAGSYAVAQSVALSTPSSDAVICYNFTGSPATNRATGCAGGSTLYSGPIPITSTQTLYAVSGGSGYTDSAVGSVAYTITAAVNAPAPVAPTSTAARVHWLRYVGIALFLLLAAAALVYRSRLVGKTKNQPDHDYQPVVPVAAGLAGLRNATNADAGAGLAITLDKYGFSASATMYVKRQQMSSPGVAAIIIATIRNVGPPTMADGWSLSIAIPGRPAILAAMIDFTAKRPGPIKIGGDEIPFEKLLYRQMLKPIATGDKRQGLIAFFVPNLTERELIGSGATITLSCRDVNERTTSQSATLSGTNEGQGHRLGRR